MSYRAAWWLPGPHLPTVYAKFFRRLPEAPAQRERWPTPDGDAVTVHRLAGRPDAPRLVLLHGLEGGVHTSYARGLFHEAASRGWWADLLVFRTCDPEHRVNAVRRAYHSGETTDLDLVVRRVIAGDPGRPVVLLGVSLGGNVLLKWLGEHGDALPREVTAGVGVSVPYDLARASRHMGQGLRRHYGRYFLRSLVEKTAAKLERFPDLVDRERLLACDSLWAFDDVVTGPTHGFRDALDYYTRCSSLGFLAGIRRPALLFNAVDDPFMPVSVLDDVRAVARDNAHLTVDFPGRGGHVGFVGGPHPLAADYWMERRALDWLAARVAESAGRGAALRSA